MPLRFRIQLRLLLKLHHQQRQQLLKNYNQLQNHFMLILEYEIIELIEWEPRIKKCCEKKKKPSDDPSGDCCYDTWMDEYEEVNAHYNEEDREVTALTNDLTYLTSQRDMWKTWYDELYKVQDSSRKICHQLQILLHQVHRMGRNTHLTDRSIRILYCMIRDFYMQLDYLKVKYDEFINCIKCINHPSLAPGQGIRILIDDYGKKLDAALSTRGAILDLLFKAISLAFQLNQNIEHRFGMKTIIKEWEKAFHCKEKCGEEPEHHEGEGQKKETEFENTDLKPHLHFPICNSRYFDFVEDQLEKKNHEVDEVNHELLEETKERDKYKAWKDGLDAVIKAVDPKTRCAPLN